MSTTWIPTTIFEFEDKQIRTLVNSRGEPFFTGKDVAEAVGYKNTKDALGKHVAEEDKEKAPMSTSSGIQTMTLINRFGLFSLIFSSEMETKRFKQWVTNELLPYIDKYGVEARIDKNLGDSEDSQVPKQTMNTVERYADLMERLGGMSDWDVHMCQERLRSAMFDDETQSGEPEKRYWSVGDAAQELGYSLSRDIAKRAGREAAKAYQQRYGKDPVEITQVINGAQRRKKLYSKADLPMVQSIIQNIIYKDNEALKDYGLRAAVDNLRNQNGNH
jgi:prophage antirepressor-like protein